MTTLVRTLMLRIYGIYAVTTFALIIVAAIAAMAVLPRLRWRRFAARLAGRLIFLVAGVPLRVQRFAPLSDEPCVVVANHASYIDGIILCAVLPPRFGFVIKREVTRAPFVHFLLRRIGSHFVERHDRQRGASDARTLLRAAGRGESLAIFPEGTFHREPGLRRFRPGAFAAAVAGRLPVVPLTIEGSRHILPARHWLPRPGRLDLTFYPAIEVSGDGRAAMQGLADATREVLLRGLDEPDLVHLPAKHEPVASQDCGSGLSRDGGQDGG